MSENISVLLANTERLEDIDAKAQELSEQSLVFRKKSVTLRKTMRWQNCKWTIALFVVFLVIGGLIALIVMLNVNGGGSGEGGGGM